MTVQSERRDPSFAQSAGLVAGREIGSRLRSRAFVISTIVLLATVLVTVVLGSIFGAQDDPDRVAVVGSGADAVAGVASLEAVPAGDLDAAERLLRDGEVTAIVAPTDLVESSGIVGDDDLSAAETGTAVPGASPFDITVVGFEDAPRSVASALSITPPVAVLDPAAVDPMLAYFVALGFGIVFFLSALTFGQTIAASVVEEKQTRIIEILLSTVSARALLTGKVLGNSAMALAQIVLIAGLAIVGLAVTGQQILLGGLGESVVWFIAFFAIGFVMLAALFAATAATVSRSEDVGTVTMPVTMLVMLPYFLVVFFNDDAAVLTAMSYVPFSAPVAMPMRIFLEQAEWWEPILSLAILVASTAVAVLAGERMYRNSLLRTGARVKLVDALRG
ncbi:ABC transporter permease [Agromyces sp. MMS24-JH15]|uniref:ABC transporter permease n=1 Tax=Agromyces sp. MMS24-JH15 TaxID=3243765 RepID=UPI003748BC4F